MARSLYFWLPLKLIIADRYNNERNVRFVKAPVLMLHGEKDTVIPIEMGERVYRAANEPSGWSVSPPEVILTFSSRVRGREQKFSSPPYSAGAR